MGICNYEDFLSVILDVTTYEDNLSVIQYLNTRTMCLTLSSSRRLRLGRMIRVDGVWVIVVLIVLLFLLAVGEMEVLQIWNHCESPQHIFMSLNWLKSYKSCSHWVFPPHPTTKQCFLISIPTEKCMYTIDCYSNMYLHMYRYVYTVSLVL